MTEDTLVDLLRQVKEVFDKHNIEFWLECGTLLGAVRDSRFIAWEHDIDLGVWYEKVPDSVRALMSKEFRDKGLKVQVLESYMTIKKGLVHTDINFYCPVDDKAVVPLLIPKNLTGKYLFLLRSILLTPYFYEIDFGNKISRSIRSILSMISHILPSILRKQIAKVILALYKKYGSENISWVVPAHYFANLASIKFYDMEFKVPAKTKEYLAYRYGEDWHIPRKEWGGYDEDGSIVKG